MKKSIQISTVVGLLLITLFFQQAQGQFISYGLKGGLNYANVGGADAPDTNPRNGFHAGAFLGVSLLGIVAAETGAYLSQKGYILDNEDATKVVSSYVDVPLVLKFSPLPLFHIFAGPQASFLIRNKVGSADASTDGLREMDLAGVVGVGINIPMGIRLSAGYDYGFKSLTENDDLKVYNRVIKFTVGYKF
jgi:hypothetical protein